MATQSHAKPSFIPPPITNKEAVPDVQNVQPSHGPAALSNPGMFAGYDPSCLEGLEIRVLKLWQELRRVDPKDIAAGAAVLIAFCKSEGGLTYSPAYKTTNADAAGFDLVLQKNLRESAITCEATLQHSATMYAVYDVYETLLQRFSEYIYIHEETMPFPVGHKESASDQGFDHGLTKRIVNFISNVCELLGFHDWCDEKPASYWRDQYASLSSKWNGSTLDANNSKAPN